MLKYIQTFLPIAIDIQFKIIAKYGFSPDNTGLEIINECRISFLNRHIFNFFKGLISFTNKLKDLSIEDDSIADLFENFKNLLIPPLNLKTHCV